MKVELLKPDQAEKLEGFVAKHPRGCVEQTWDWGVLQLTIPGRDAMFVLGVFDEDELVGSMLLVRQHMGKGRHWLWAPGGPLLPMVKSDADEAWALLEETCERLALQDGDVFLRVEPVYEKCDEFPVKGRPSKECYLPRNTLVVDLDDDEAGILAQMKQKGRYNIKKADAAGVYVRKSDLADLPEFYGILQETAERDGFHLHKREFYGRFLDLLENKARFYVAHIDGEMLGGMLVTHFGGVATYYFGASSDAHRNAMAPYAMQWFAMQEAKAAGMKKYDFLGIAPEGPAGDGHVLSGVTQFKTRFGGMRKNYHPAQVFVYRRGWWLAYRAAKFLKRLLPF
jgi:peptidoglycan pentaglycine glycine transferase (the first glycine)